MSDWGFKFSIFSEEKITPENQDTFGLDLSKLEGNKKIANLKRRFSSWVQILSDLDKAQRFFSLFFQALPTEKESLPLNFSKITPEETLREGLFLAGVMSLARTFVTGNNRATHIQKAMLRNNPILEKLFDEILELRHKFFAHPDISEHENLVISFIVKQNAIGENSYGFEFDHRYTGYQHYTQVEFYVDLIRFCHSQVRVKMQEICNDLNNEINILKNQLPLAEVSQE
ncbi:MAG: hypothetical protein HKM04_08850 [Legionellales bacterium]|nr:hypothetical protein [Legionellales bacterium]